MNEWDDVAGGWDDDPAARAYAAAAFESLLDLLDGPGLDRDDLLADMNVLDFGCGTGLLTERLVGAGATVYAVDSSPAMLAVLDDKIDRHGWTTVGTSAELPPVDVRFDLVVCSSVLAFVDDYVATTGTLVERLRAGGRFVQWDWERVVDGEHGLTRAEMRTTLSAAGLVDVEGGTAFSLDVGGHTMAPLVGTGTRLHTRR